MQKIIDETGNRYGRLTVLGRAEKKYQRGSTSVYWWCQCECGNKKAIKGTELRYGHHTSCGCSKTTLRTLPKGIAAFNALVSTMRYSAKKRGYQWQLTKEQVRYLTKQPCHYCGAKPAQVFSRKTHNGAYIYNGLDRIDNAEGYILSNVVPCCGICNHAKSAMTVEEFEAWAIKLCTHFVGG